MTARNPSSPLVDRRTVLLRAGALAFVAAGAGPAAAQSDAPARAAPADTAPLVPTPQFEQAYANIVGNGTPTEGAMALELPEDAENGNIVPYKINVESPMTDDDHIERVHLLSTQNPQALVATFHFTPLSGSAAVSGRMRLAKTQEVVAIAVTSRDTLIAARTLVNVGIGGCGVE
ncbi:thiosulfate oxidation carrier protein SoxY [Hyphomicrobium sp. CS1GBMeth3]|uniref:thiosulfate oxidation carrier protein SoxY n=1 Tax=Hyphomicrobium sp. CS1GBMeth3 TaxID=1892845 RepID=UPI000A79B12F|nr:thiosulfate oxidation carrier protein SoxY [Hyphomicrobium sp. CS1GBMeth3]